MVATSIPALIALVLKLGLLTYALFTPRRNFLTNLFLVLVAVFTVQNVVEFVGLNELAARGAVKELEAYGFAWVAFLMVAVAVLLHISLRVSFDLPELPGGRAVATLIYAPLLGLLYLLLFTDLVIQGFRPYLDAVVRVPGPYYFLAATYFALYILASLANLIYGARRGRPSATARARNRLWLLAILPTAALVMYLVAAQHLGIAKLTGAVYLPITVTFFLLVTAYAISHQRLFDVDILFPWSRNRRERVAFRARIDATADQAREQRTPHELLERLRETLHCAVALASSSRPLMAAAGLPVTVAEFPREALKEITTTTVRDEIRDTNPALAQKMTEHGIEAVVPCFPNSKTLGSWLLLGEGFSKNVYSTDDFEHLEHLIAAVRDHLIDKIPAADGAFAEMERRARVAREINEKLQNQHDSLVEENRRLRAQIGTTAVAAGVVTEVNRDGTVTLDDMVAELETKIITQVLEQCEGNRAEAARRLGLRANTFHYKLERYGLNPKKKKATAARGG